MALDPRTAVLISGIMGALMAMVLFFMHRSYPRSIRGLKCWALALFMLFAAGVLASLRHLAPVWITSVIPNLLVSTAMYVAYTGTQRFFGVAVRPAGAIALIATGNLALLWFTLVQPSFHARVLLLSPLLAALLAVHARLVIGQQRGTFAHRFVAAVLCLATLNETLRIVTALTLGASGDLFDRQPHNVLHITAYPVLMLMMAIGFVLLATERLRAELEHMATHDSLTNALTRRHMNEAIEQELERCRRYGRTLSLLVMDLDHFKAINDNHGHQLGDRVLIGFVEKVNALLRRGDELGRFGGEEFVVLLPETPPAEAMQVAGRIRAACDADGATPSCTVSIGVTSSSGPPDNVDTLLARADAAMYRAKQLGRNRVESD